MGNCRARWPNPRTGAFLSLCLLLSLVCVACARSVGGGVREPRPDGPYALVDQLGRVLVEVENEYVDPVDRAKLLRGALKGMVAELDPHSSYMPADEFRLFESDTEGEFGGVGVEVEAKDGKLVVLLPIEGSPADRAGIRSGDVIVGVDGRDPSADPIDKLVKDLRGEPGSSVILDVQRPGATAKLTFTLKREVIRVASVSSKLLGDGIAYIAIKQFQEHTHDELLRAIGTLRSRSRQFRGVVVDLRNDPGGLVDQAAAVADEFLDEGVIYTARHRGVVVEEVAAAAGGALLREPCVVLVNQYTASASELVAGALQDHGRATVVGQRTFGKGSVQSILSLPGGAGLRLTVARYYTPGGHAIQADGVHPDVTVRWERDSSTPSLREKDLEGHLTSEVDLARETSSSKRVVVIPGEAPPPKAIALGTEARDVPDDPEKGDDAVLKVGWETLLQELGPAGH